MSAVFEEIYSLLVPIAGGRLIVPRAAVVEVMGYNAPKERPADAPEWLLGWIHWQNARIPLISIEAASGQPLPEFKSRTRIAVVQAIAGLLDPPAFALATQGYPYLLRVNRNVLKLDESDEPLPAQILTRLRMANERPGVPDLEALERMLAVALGIPLEEPLLEAIEVTADEPTALGTASLSLARDAIEMPEVAGELRIDDDTSFDDIAAALDDATADAALEPGEAEPARRPEADEKFGDGLDDLSIEGLVVDEDEPK